MQCQARQALESQQDLLLLPGKEEGQREEPSPWRQRVWLEQEAQGGAATPPSQPLAGAESRPLAGAESRPLSGGEAIPCSDGQAIPAPSPASRSGGHNVFDVLDFGAKGDGVAEDTKAFMAAWAAACKVEGSTVLVPSDYEFLLGPSPSPALLPAQHRLPGNLRPRGSPEGEGRKAFAALDGTVVAPTSSKAWGTGLLQWLEFTKLKGITIKGKGVIEGHGAVWWSQSQFEYEPLHRRRWPFPNDDRFPSPPLFTDCRFTALRFYGSVGVTVTGITIQNSPQCHLKFDNCAGVEVFNMSISSPGNSINTTASTCRTPGTSPSTTPTSAAGGSHAGAVNAGDDCVSIQTGCSNVNIHSVNWLGRDDTKACVSNITVQNVAMQGTMTGVRIKTWQGGSGSVQNVKFSGIRMMEVQTPIVIDQYYCDRTTCRNQTAAVALSGISYENIKGTYTVKPVHFACSDSLPCSDIRLTNIELRPLQEHYHMYNPFCWQTFGELLTPAVPPSTASRRGSRSPAAPCPSSNPADLPPPRPLPPPPCVHMRGRLDHFRPLLPP
ncbi:unnamed protein product [Spirodela intermedia]|uniref:Uncharacterized protein n=1 Tax=Spirodela intermedia TaxID=51605 RepID=A0A7I8J5N7_SPIIN|nr:unnamed protein product [Spirodela intermedia]CAA6665548.1 unnamed protein product [Spirodela intermedia]